MEEGEKAGVCVMLEDIELRFSRENWNPKRERKWQLASRHNWSRTKLGSSNPFQLHFQTAPPFFNCFNFLVFPHFAAFNFKVLRNPTFWNLNVWFRKCCTYTTLYNRPRFDRKLRQYPHALSFEHVMFTHKHFYRTLTESILLPVGVTINWKTNEKLNPTGIIFNWKINETKLVTWFS